MHTKIELEALTIDELTAMAKGLNISVKKNTEKLDLIYDIIPGGKLCRPEFTGGQITDRHPESIILQKYRHEIIIFSLIHALL